MIIYLIGAGITFGVVLVLKKDIEKYGGSMLLAAAIWPLFWAICVGMYVTCKVTGEEP